MASNDLFDLAAKISADTSGVDAKLTATQRKVLELAEQFKATEAAATTSNKKIEASELSLAAQMKAVESLQRQRSAAFIAQLKQQEQSSLVTRGAIRALGATIGSELPGPAGQAARQFSYLASSTSGASAAMEFMFNPVVLTAAAVGALAIGTGVAGFALIEATSDAAEFANKLQTVHDETGLSVETLQALQLASDVTGVKFDA